MKDAYLDDLDLDGFDALTAEALDPAQVPLASDVQKNVPLYDVGALDLTGPGRRAVMAEWADVLLNLSGVLVLKRAYADTAPIDAATKAFDRIIAREKGQGGADHFAASGANDRIWNALQKLCLDAPEVFAPYHGNIAVDAVCEAWLGPGYQMTAQVNLVRPGGKAQTAHRDYHLGFQTEEAARRFPAHVHALSPVLTLQGGIAHVDMPVESGPTKLLPFSQRHAPGYLAYRHKAFREMFEDRFVQLPLEKGDAIFFNPALFHGAGDNVSSDIARMVNLLQVSSPMGRTMEAVDRSAMCRALYPVLAQGDLNAARRAAAIAACAEGYSFPTNLDTDPPEGGLAPETQAALMARALDEGMDPAAFDAALVAQDDRRRA